MPPTNDLAISREPDRAIARETPAYNPPEDERRRVASIKRTYEEKELSKRAYEKTWFVNGSFLRGQQYVVFNDYTRTFDIPYRIPQHRVRLTINLSQSHWRRTKARLTARKPAFFIRPASTEQADVERSRIQLKVLESEHERLAFYRRFKSKIGWMLETGTAFYHPKWNPRAGPQLYAEEPVVDPETGAPALDLETGEPQTKTVPLTDQNGRPLHQGENELEIVNSYELDVDPEVSDEIDQARWVRRDKVRSLEWIRDNYPEKGRYVTSEKVQVHTLYQKRLRQLVGIFGYTTESDSGESDSDSPRDSAVVHEYWEKATEKYPRGRLIVVAGHVELHNGENPYDHQKYPFIPTREIEIPGRFWGMATIEQLVPIQKNYNRARSQEVENRTLMGRPKILVPRTAKIRQASFDAEPGEKIDYNPGPRGERPEIIWPQSTAAATQTEIQHTLSDFQEVAGAHEAFRGVMPSANAPAAAIERLQAADETTLGEVATNIDNALVEVGKMLLANCAQFWTEERLVRAGGTGAKLETLRVKGSDLAGQDPSADYYDVRVIPQSTLMKDPTTQREQVKELIEMRILDPVLHREVIMKSLDVANVDEVFADQRLDEQWSERENEAMETGQPMMPRDFEDHSVHLKVLDRYRKSERYRMLPPELQQLFDQHAQMHKALMVQVEQERAMMAASVQMAGMPPGAPPPDGQPAPEGQQSQPPEGERG